ncbi:KpsF/GutQ family sugar-phosphate isomerase [Marinobacter vinifirmus]|uniref:KpsF/GutQ family sugar-phosphate isomerase n=1 Tax=Marinobacter vinifirmus TaxID=355591 RepID=UPI000B9B4A09|nr:KpsF/GutQ family sugar-phosphate isomerase [Marinobacter vinifirmus]
MSSVDVGKRVFLAQGEALKLIGKNLDQSFDHAVDLIMKTSGKVIVSGMGKSGIIGKKIAATFASTGTPSFFVHPAEAFHGDLGMFAFEDVVILISYSGETEEVIRLVPSLKHFGVKVIALVGRPDSTLGRNVDVVLSVAVEREVCPNNLAPTTSTTATLAMGDALAVALIEKRDFKPVDFAVFHPGGSLGRSLLTKVQDVMHSVVPNVHPDSCLKDVIMVITQGGLGLSVVLDGEEIVGIITDGDLRRALFRKGEILNLRSKDIMSNKPLTILCSELVRRSEEKMLDSGVTALLVLDEFEKLAGIVKLQDVSRI